MLANTTGSFKITSISQIANTSKISREPILSEQQIFQAQQIYQIRKCIKQKITSKISLLGYFAKHYTQFSASKNIVVFGSFLPVNLHYLSQGTKCQKKIREFFNLTPYAYADKGVHKIISVKIENMVNKIWNSAKSSSS